MLKELEGEYTDWGYVFAYATGQQDSPLQVFPGGKTKPAVPFGREDVESIEKLVDGENDGANWLFLGALKNGKWAFISAGCDYTGWGCQEGGVSRIAEDRDTLIRWAMDANDRERCGIKLPEELERDEATDYFVGLLYRVIDEGHVTPRGKLTIPVALVKEIEMVIGWGNEK